jgi:hypothetical protein
MPSPFCESVWLQVLGLSYLLYYAQRSGKLSSAPYNPISWRKDSHLTDRVPGGCRSWQQLVKGFPSIAASRPCHCLH